MNLTQHSIRKPVTTLMIFVCFVVLGIISARMLPLEFFPDLDAPFIFIDIPYPGSTPQEIEREITRPAEEALATIGDVERMTSRSGENGAWIRLNFEWGIDANLKALEAKEKLEGVRHLFPRDLERFNVRKFSTSDMEMLILRLSSQRDLSGSYDMLNRNLKRRIERIPGVSKVELYGVEKKEIRILLEMDRVISHGVDINSLVQRLERGNFLVTAGKITDNTRRLVVRPVGEYQSVDEIAEIPVAGPNLRLKDIADISYAMPKLDYGRHLNRRYAVGLNVYKESGANLVDVNERIMEELDIIRGLPEMEGINIFYMDNQAEGVVSSLNELLKAGLLGGFLAVLVLYFFLRRFSTTLIVALAVPLSILVTMTFMYLTGLTLNILSMMGLMLAVGMLVDNAVVVTESIHRHQTLGLPPEKAVPLGVKEVALAITAGTFTTAIVFLPNIVSPNDEISIYIKHVALSICIALGVSLILAQTVVPLITSMVRPPRKKRKRTVVDRMVDRYAGLLSWSLRHRRISTGAILLTLASIAVPGMMVESDMFRESESRRFRLHYHINDSYTVEKVESIVDIFEEYLFTHKDTLEIESVYSYYQGDYASSTILLTTGDKADRPVEDIKEQILGELPKTAVANPSFTWQEGDQGRSVRISLTGKSSEELAAISREVAWSLSEIPGLKNARSEAEVGEKEVQVTVDRERARQYGLSPRDIARVVAAGARGIRLRTFRDETGEVDMWLRFQDEDRQTVEQLGNIPVRGSEHDTPVRLASLVDFRIAKGPRAIFRNNRTTSMGVSASLDGITMNEARNRIGAVMANYDLPPGYSWNYGERFDYEQEAMNTMLLNIMLALALIYFVMASLFESLIFPAAMWTQILFSIVGVYWFFLITGTTMTVMAMIGILILIGVVVNNGIVLIDHINNLRSGDLSRREAIIQAGRDRMRPILMTAATTVLSLVPLCLVKTQVGGPGGPPYYPMARAIVGGLTFATLVTLLILPTIYCLLDDLRAWARRVIRKSHA